MICSSSMDPLPDSMISKLQCLEVSSSMLLCINQVQRSCQVLFVLLLISIFVDYFRDFFDEAFEIGPLIIILYNGIIEGSGI